MREDGQRTCFMLGKTPGAERILLWDDFESLFKWGSLTGFPTPRTVFRVNIAYDGNYGMWLGDRLLTPDGMRWLGVGRSCIFGVSKVVSIEAMFYFPLTFSLPGAGFYCEFIHDGILYRWGFRFDVWWRQLFFYNSQGRWFRDTRSHEKPAVGAWHRFGLVADVAKLRYVGVTVDGEFYSFADTGMYNRGTVAADKFEVGVLIGSLFVGRCSSYVDDVLVRCM